MPTSVAAPTASALLSWIFFCAWSSVALIWVSVTCSGPSRSQSRIWSMPLETWVDRSLTPEETWLPTKVTSRPITPMPSTTTSRAAALRGSPSRCSHATSGLTSAAISIAITIGSITTRKKFSSHRISPSAAAITRKRHDQAAARSTP